MSWNAFLPPVEQVSTGSAIIAKNGARCGYKGSWNATTAEEVNFTNILKNPYIYIGKGLTYNRTKYIIVRATNEMVLAVKPHERIMFKQSNLVIVCAHFSTYNGQNPEKVSNKIDYVITTLLENSL